jgi:hypothetical protein
LSNWSDGIDDDELDEDLAADLGKKLQQEQEHVGGASRRVWRCWRAE